MNLIERIKALKIPHYECDDGYYSCGLVENHLGQLGGQCTCGADDHNKKVDALMADLQTPVEEVLDTFEEKATEAFISTYGPPSRIA